MDLFQLIQSLHEELNAASIEHALIGGFALAAHSVHRATADVDLLVDESDVPQLKDLMTRKGFRLVHDSPDVLQYSGTGPVDFLVARRPLSRTMLAEAQMDPALGMRVVGIEGLIGLKIQAYSNDRSRKLKDLADVQALIQSGRAIDFARVKSYADLFQEWPTIEKVRKGENDLD